jgi:hypothetical protein
MWSHYSESHTGIAIEFELNKDEDFFAQLHSVKYKESYTKTNYPRDRVECLREIITTKSSVWFYENEFRIIKGRHGLHKIKPSAMTSIYFGCNSTQESISKIKSICTNNGLIWVNFYQAFIPEGEFNLKFKILT